MLVLVEYYVHEDHTNDNLVESNSEKNVCFGESTSTQVSIALIFKFKPLGIVWLGPSPKLKREGKRYGQNQNTSHIL